MLRSADRHLAAADQSGTRTASLILAAVIGAEIAYAWYLTRRRVLY
jgi:hypothetical protein